MDLFQLFFGVRAGLNFRSILVLILGCILPYVFQKTSYTKIKIVEYSSFEFASLPANNNLKSRLVLYFLAHYSLDFKSLFVGTEAY